MMDWIFITFLVCVVIVLLLSQADYICSSIVRICQKYKQRILMTVLKPTVEAHMNMKGTNFVHIDDVLPFVKQKEYKDEYLDNCKKVGYHVDKERGLIYKP